MNVPAAPAARPHPLSATFEKILAAIAAGRHADAVALAERAVAQAPDSPDAWNALGVALRVSGDPRAAMGCHRRALDLAPGNVAARINLGNAALELDRIGEAVAWLREVATLRPSAKNHADLGHVLHDAGLTADAVAAFDAALALDPENPRARCERGQVLLRLGRHAEGWPDFEWRWRLPDMPPMPKYSTPLWDGRKIDGTVIVWPEQGFGDAILSARFLPVLRDRVGRFLLGAKPELIRLFEGLPGVDELVPLGAPQPRHAANVPMMALPGLAMRSLADLPPPATLHVPADSRARMAPLVGRTDGRLRVGIVWSGSVTFKANAQRATGLDRFLAFADIPGVQLYSLQKGPRAAELESSGARNFVVDLGRHCRDFADTAAAVEALDLVIMTDSSVAHLAGSLGKPVWNLLPFSAYWLYGQDPERTAWYPTMRLFRQGAPGDWGPVFDAARRALAELAPAAKARDRG
jgi:Flp pilus assembly protein TadD